jgi:MFS family permease
MAGTAHPEMQPLMTEAIDIRPSEARSRDGKVIGLIGAAHFVSHYYILLLPPLFPFVKADYGVTYTQLGFAITAFNISSAALQTPAGFLVDRIGARAVLLVGLSLGAVAVAVAALVPSFWVLVAMFALAGVANTVYHPADYAILSQVISAKRMGSAFSIHTFLGVLGGAAAPASLLFLQNIAGWRGAFLGAAVLALAVAALLAVHSPETFEPVRPVTRKPSGGHAKKSSVDGWRLLLSGPILLNLIFFIAMSLANGGVQNYSVVALGALHATPPSLANAGLSAYLLFSALGVLAGGFVVNRTTRTDIVAGLGLLAAGAGALIVGFVPLNSYLLVLVMAASGFSGGVIMPSRDMIVRAVTPEGAFGRVFGFVTTGFNIAGIVAPLMFGWLMDSGNPQAIFVISAACGVIAIFTVAAGHLRPFRARIERR